jgi:hypothetical protein
MKYFPILYIPLSQADNFLERIGKAMRSAGDRVEVSSLSIFILLPVILALIYALRFAYNSLFKRKYEAPVLLFIQLCRIHGLSYRERLTLRRAATRWEISDPCLLFIDHQLWKFDEIVHQIAPSNLKQKDLETFNLLSLYSRFMRDGIEEQNGGE